MNAQTPQLIDDVMPIGVTVTDQDQALEFHVEKLASKSAGCFRCGSSVGAGSTSRQQA